MPYAATLQFEGHFRISTSEQTPRDSKSLSVKGLRRTCTSDLALYIVLLPFSFSTLQQHYVLNLIGMASTAPNESILTESTAHSAPWYRTHPRATHLTPQICNFFQSYTGVADEDLDAHILDIVIHSFSCIFAILLIIPHISELR
jgi:hypothetical protein